MSVDLVPLGGGVKGWRCPKHDLASANSGWACPRCVRDRLGIQIIEDRTMPPGTFEVRSSIDRVRVTDVGTAKRGRGKVCYREGCRLDSQAEGKLWDRLRADNPTGAIFAHVAYPLIAASVQGEKVRRFTVDLVVRRVDGVTVAHEVKGPRVIDSRDFGLRWGLFKAAFPELYPRLWRVEKGVLTEVER